MPLTRRGTLAAGLAVATATLAGSLPKKADAEDSLFDVVIVGAGSAGAVLASRLSAEPARRVLLLEAGPSFAPDGYPANLKDPASVGVPEFDWHYETDDSAKLGHNIPVPRGRVLGGSSAVNGSVAMRARPSDFERWAERGISDWAWNDVLATYKAMENTPGGADEWHGRSGPFPIRQRHASENTASMNAFVEASRQLGFPYVGDFNGADQLGVGEYPLNIVDGVRINTGIAYLTEAVRSRKNLTILANAEVDNLLVEKAQVTGVRLVDGRVITAAETILAAGSFGSPAILLRSGIGPKDHLAELAIPVVADLPVGDRLQDHPFFFNVYALKTEAKAMTPAAGAIIWTHSSSAGPDELDLHISGTHFIAPSASPTGGAIVLAAAVTLPKSIGRFRLVSKDPRSAPLIHYNFFDDPSDLDRMVEAVELARTVGRTEPFAGLIDQEILPGPGIRDGKQLRENIKANVAAYLHPTSTVPMGADSDPTAAVDSFGKVRGIDNLRVVDASILPDIPSVATNVTTIMVAERIAARIA